ncbi:hypothetical protein EVAR_8032_1 [Eumeta japonica]|uniref:Uncharacterized protein n=1 Tax=Eumeta variegata TaxID=151549 RepID=A0A4C1TK43_EUMVA|nr:hypothetical protein EVAR_8032_1 [Eumeta japonica]
MKRGAGSEPRTPTRKLRTGPGSKRCRIGIRIKSMTGIEIITAPETDLKAGTILEVPAKSFHIKDSVAIAQAFRGVSKRGRRVITSLWTRPLSYLLLPGKTINSDLYCQQLMRLEQEAKWPEWIKRKGGVDKKLAEKEERAKQRRWEENKRNVGQKELLAAASTSTSNNLECPEDSDEEQIFNSELRLPDVPCPEKSSKRDKTLDEFVRDVSSWDDNAAFLEAKRRIRRLKFINDPAERAVKLMQDFNGLITPEEDQKQFLLRCVQEHRNLYPDCNKTTLREVILTDSYYFMCLNKY